jgi:hypothetical protein
MTRVRYIPDQSQLSHALGFDHEVLWVLAVIKLQRNKPAPFGALHRLNLVGRTVHVVGTQRWAMPSRRMYRY